MKTLSDIRKALKPLGFKLKTTSTSWGRAAIYCHANGEPVRSIFFDAAQLEAAKPLIDWREQNRAALKAIRESEGVTGLL